MNRSKSADYLISGRRRWWMKPSHLLLAAAALYLLFISSKFHRFVEIAIVLGGGAADDAPLTGAMSAGDHLVGSVYRAGDKYHRELEDALSLSRARDPLVFRAAPATRGINENSRDVGANSFVRGYGRITGEVLRRYSRTGGRRRSGNFSEFERSAQEAWTLGLKAWSEAQNYSVGSNFSTVVETEHKPCPLSLSMSADEVKTRKDLIMLLPCGLAVGSSITVVGTPNEAHAEYVQQLARMRLGDGMVMVSQFMVELQGLKAVDGEDPPKILHLNPRLKGDWSERPVIEHNTCYRMQWGKAMRCDGLPTKDGDETVDGFSKCEKWERDDDHDPKGSKTTSWLNRFIGRAKKPEMTWPFPFAEGKLFVLTIQAGVEGFHIYIGGRHVSSFPFRTGFTLQDATGLEIKGNVDIHSVYATSLPISHPSFSLQQALEMSEKWKAPSLPQSPVHLFIGILSATNHFAERMAIRKSWMQYPALQSSYAVARFFVALSQRKEVNAALKKEAEYFNDIVILPFVDRYELVVLKTIAICEYGVRNLTASYIMKCDDDTFVRVDVMLKEIDNVAQKGSIYIGNINYLHRPLRSGKWAVTYEEWPEDIYPPYANGPGYIISNDIAKFIVSQHANQSLRLFKMEDVSMGMWVEDFNATTPVHYSHNWKFCQYGCMDSYYTSHYQSPRQMLCLWDKLSHGRAHCCNFR